jgi:uncharacterized protein
MAGSHELPDHEAALIVAATRRWLELAVIGLNLCPFAKPVATAGRIRYAVSPALAKKALRDDLIDELGLLVAADPELVETTLLIHPWALQEFHAFNDFLAEADEMLEDLELVGIVQIASFHPHYQFAGTSVDDIENATNRSPFPTLHLLREASIEHAVQSMAYPDVIYRRNIETMRLLGESGWQQLQAKFAAVATASAPHDDVQSTGDSGANDANRSESV